MFTLMTFMGHVRKANGHFERIKRSSLHTLIEVLREKPTASADRVRTELAQIPAEKKQFYKVALDYLNDNYPGLKPVVVPKVTAPKLTPPKFTGALVPPPKLVVPTGLPPVPPPKFLVPPPPPKTIVVKDKTLQMIALEFPTAVYSNFE